jgi:3',5'-cyclic AMP phosphodiesterase CpdA
MPAAGFFRDFALKRMFGGLSWLRRRRVHNVKVADLLAQDVLASDPDHIAVTGDLVNVSAAFEFPRSLAWLGKLGKPEDVTFTPGNHDAYVPIAFEGLEVLKSFTAGDMRRNDAVADRQPYPFIRLRRNMAFIGLNSACPQSLFRAGGRLGRDQIQTLATDLAELKSRGFYRVVLIHHPPIPGLAKPRKALDDAAELRDVLLMQGAELVLHGHNHIEMFNWLDGSTPIHGVASASSTGQGHHAPATWHCYTVDRAKGQWRTMVMVRSYDAAKEQFETVNEFELKPPAVKDR